MVWPNFFAALEAVFKIGPSHKSTPLVSVTQSSAYFCHVTNVTPMTGLLVALLTWQKHSPNSVAITQIYSITSWFSHDKFFFQKHKSRLKIDSLKEEEHGAGWWLGRGAWEPAGRRPSLGTNEPPTTCPNRTAHRYLFRYALSFVFFGVKLAKLQ